MTLGFVDVFLLPLSIPAVQQRALFFLCSFELGLQISNSDVGQAKPQYRLLVKNPEKLF